MFEDLRPLLIPDITFIAAFAGRTQIGSEPGPLELDGRALLSYFEELDQRISAGDEGFVLNGPSPEKCRLATVIEIGETNNGLEITVVARGAEWEEMDTAALGALTGGTP